ncbi:MAG: alpha/beta hydrolase [Alphaproteobacteria bacterium]
MVETRQIAVADGLSFTVWTDGPEAAPLVLLLHGYPQSRHAWRAQIPPLAAAGCRVVAPDQRGYSPGARPDPTRLANYDYDKLVADAVAIADAAGAAGQRFHLVGHDWGGQVAWGVADRHPDRLASLAILSRPHPSAFRAALADPDGDQKHRSRHHRKFLEAETADLLLADGCRRLRRNLAAQDVPAAIIEDYVGVLGGRPAMEAALAWYRANAGLKADIGTIAVPTLYVWGDADSSVGRKAAEGTAAYVSADYRFEILPGIGHFSTDQSPDRVSELLVDHIRRHSD